MGKSKPKNLSIALTDEEYAIIEQAVIACSAAEKRIINKTDLFRPYINKLLTDLRNLQYLCRESRA
jgi:hypothetical protein